MSTVSFLGSSREITHAFHDLSSRLTGWNVVEGEMAETPGLTLECQHARRADLNLVTEPRGTGAQLAHILVAFRGGKECNCSKALRLEVRRTPFTETEMTDIRKFMPLTSSSESWLETGEDLPLRGLAAIFTIHHQRDFLVLLEELIRCGLDPEDVVVVDKEYQYEYRDRVDGYLRYEMGVRVVEYSLLDREIPALFERVREPSTWKKVVLIDDGGYLYPRIREVVPTKRLDWYVLGVVEQTSSGINVIRPYLNDLRVPLFDVAESDLKSTVEARGVARAALRSLQRALPDVHWGGRRAVVTGFGRIGHALAEELRRADVVTAVVDSDYASLVAAREDGFTTFESLADAVIASRPHLIFGATGAAARRGQRGFADEIIDNMTQDCVLVSTTSRNYEFDVKQLAERSSETEVAPYGTVYVFRQARREQRLHLVADGFPINFYGAESMPNQLLLSARMISMRHYLLRSGWALRRGRQERYRGYGRCGSSLAGPS